MDAGRYTFALDIPPDFQRDVLAGRQPAIQLNVDATRMSQAFTGAGYIQTIVTGEVPSLPAAPPARRRAAGRSGAARALQPDARQVLVRRRDGGDQQHHHAVDHADRRGADPRARARHHRAPAGDAGDAARDHDRQGLGDGAGGAGRLRLVADCSSSRDCWRCRSRARWRCSWPAPRCTCSPPPRWASSSAPWRARCRSSGCC